MNTELRVRVLRATLFTALPLVLGMEGCASSTVDKEGAYDAPAGFTASHSLRAALSPDKFTRVENKVVSTTVLQRRAARLKLGTAEDSKSTDPDDNFRLETTFHGTYADGMTVAISQQPNASLKVVPLGAKPAASRVRSDGALVAFENAFEHVTSAFGASNRKVEEFLSIPTENDIPTLSYALTAGPDFGELRAEEGTIWAFAKDGSGLFTIAPPFADDARGKRVEGSWKLEGGPASYTLTAQIDLRGLAFPVLLDPTFETPEWFLATNGVQPSVLAAAAGAYANDQSCAVLFGGATANFSLNNSTSVRCSVDQKWQAGIGTSGTAPTPRAYSAAAYFGGASNPGTYVFGGFTTTANNDMYRLNLNAGCASSSSACTGAWTPIPVSGTWPAARLLHGLGYDGTNLILWGGISSSGAGYRDVWKFDGVSWTLVCDQCFGGTNGHYGFAYTTLVAAGGARSLYSNGGYDNPNGGGSFINTMSRFNGSGWDDLTTNDAVVPVSSTGVITTGANVNPQGRYLHWLSGTNNDNLLLGSGIFNSQATSSTADTYENDAWLWQNLGAAGNQWLRSGVTATAPGYRESATTIFDEVKRQTILFGGLDNSSPQVALNAGRVYRGVLTTVNLTQHCTDSTGVGTCDNSQFTLVADFPGFDATNCGFVQSRFIIQDAITSQWATIPSANNVPAGSSLVTASFAGGVCSATLVTTWNNTNNSDVGVQARDLRYATPNPVATHLCAATAGDVSSTGGKPVCAPNFPGVATCGGLIDPSLVMPPTAPCTNF